MPVEHYEPPYTVTEKMLMLVAQISENIGKISNYHSFETKPHLRRNNRIRSVWSSVAIEANSLSLDEVKGVIDGKTVIGPGKDIQEVKNAYQAYDLLGSFDPFSLEELTDQTVNQSGVFRDHGEGVFRGNKCIFMAPPPELVPDHMQSLFAWLKSSGKSVHPLILSSVFHYEFVFIHPFEDGNGRMARLWQTALLAQWKPIFQYLPLENRIYEFQQEYYDAIATCHAYGNSDLFIEFMLDKMNLTLDWAIKQVSEKDAYLSESVQRLLDVMEYDVPYTAARLMQKLQLKSRANFHKLYLEPALERSLIIMSIPDKPTSRNQSYIRK